MIFLCRRCTYRTPDLGLFLDHQVLHGIEIPIHRPPMPASLDPDVEPRRNRKPALPSGTWTKGGWRGTTSKPTHRRPKPKRRNRDGSIRAIPMGPLQPPGGER